MENVTIPDTRLKELLAAETLLIDILIAKAAGASTPLSRSMQDWLSARRKSREAVEAENKS